MTSILSWLKQFSTAKHIFNVFSLYLRPLIFHSYLRSLALQSTTLNQERRYNLFFIHCPEVNLDPALLFRGIKVCKIEHLKSIKKLLTALLCVNSSTLCFCLCQSRSKASTTIIFPLRLQQPNWYSGSPGMACPWNICGPPVDRSG